LTSPRFDKLDALHIPNVRAALEIRDLRFLFCDNVRRRIRFGWERHIGISRSGEIHKQMGEVLGDFGEIDGLQAVSVRL
jgi:hypothetical protein